MEHIERMRALRGQVDIIIEHSTALAALNAQAETSIVVHFKTTARDPGGMTTSTAHSLSVPVVELRALIQRRIDDAEARLRKLGMVAPRPGPVSFAPAPPVREDTPSDKDTTPPEEPS